MKKPPTSLTSRYAHHYLKRRYGIEGDSYSRASNFDSKGL